MRTALITGITGQDGAYLAELLLAKGYVVHGIRRRSSSFNSERIDHLYQDPHEPGTRLFLHYGDMTDSTGLVRVVDEVQPDEVYNLAAQSHVSVSFVEPEYTANADALGALRLLEAIRIAAGATEATRFYQASTSEMYGQRRASRRRTSGTPFPSAQPVRRRQAVRALDHDQLPRGLRHVRVQRHPVQSREPDPGRNLRDTQDHARAVAESSSGCRTCLYLGNLDAKRDWGHARDYVEASGSCCSSRRPDDS